MSSFFDLKNLGKIFLSLNRRVSTFDHLNKKIPIANFYISRKIKERRPQIKKN